MAAPVDRRLGLPAWHPAFVLATWFGAGLLPLAPGTWGSLAALPLAWALDAVWGKPGLLLGALAVFLVGWLVSGIVARASGVKDAGAIVIDEVAAQLLVLAVAPRELVAYLLGFLLFRAADILKPWPAGWADRNVGGGLGIMLDDVFAAIYAGALLVAILQLGRPVLGP